MPHKNYGLVVHGGAGAILRGDMPPGRIKAYEEKLSEALEVGYAILAAGGSALDTVVAAVKVLEDSPLFNAAHGAVLNSDGICELDASLMDGRSQAAGSVAALQHIRNPITLARDVMQHSSHVMLVGPGAERFAQELGYELVPNDYFQTAWRKQQLAKAKLLEAQTPPASSRSTSHPVSFVTVDDNDAVTEQKWGTVGCAALDQAGNLAAGTSTGGMTNKKFGRVGDSPIVGAGTYANNTTCAVSATGHGEFFIRAVVGHDISARMEYQGVSLREATTATLQRVAELGGSGGVIAIDKTGQVSMNFNTPGMYRGFRLSNGDVGVAMFER